MSKWIDADNAIERLGAYLMTDAQIEYGGLASEDIEDWKPIATDILKGAPSIDIVRCKECKWYKHYRKQFTMERRGDGLCDRCNYVMNDDDFCSYGEGE